VNAARAVVSLLMGLFGAVGPGGAVEVARRELARLGYDAASLEVLADARDTVDLGGRRCWAVEFRGDAGGARASGRLLVDARRRAVVAVFLSK
jgi:hypothetical protein